LDCQKSYIGQADTVKTYRTKDNNKVDFGLSTHMLRNIHRYVRVEDDIEKSDNAGSDWIVNMKENFYIYSYKFCNKNSMKIIIKTSSLI
jgi:hypothetical protein